MGGVLGMAGSGRLLGITNAAAGGLGGASSAAGLITQFDAYVQNAQQIPRLEQSGGLTAAIARADTGSSIAADLSRTLGRRITAAQARFESEAASATSAIAGLEIAIPVLTALAAALALLGLRARLEEYR